MNTVMLFTKAIILFLKVTENLSHNDKFGYPVVKGDSIVVSSR